MKIFACIFFYIFVLYGNIDNFYNYNYILDLDMDLVILVFVDSKCLQICLDNDTSSCLYGVRYVEDLLGHNIIKYKIRGRMTFT